MIPVMNMEMLKRKPNRIKAYNYSQNGAYFITVCTLDRKKILSKITVPLNPEENATSVELLKHGIIADKYIKQMNSFYDHLSVDRYMIMPDHIHFLITIHEGQEKCAPISPEKRTSVIARFVGTFKRFCNKEYGENIWQGRYYDHVIRNQQDYDEIWEYIENNPHKWAMMKQGWD